MPIITISRGSYSRGKEVAEKVAQKLGYECISRGILIEASEEFNVPEIELLHAVRDAPSILERFTFGKERYVAYIRAALLSHLQRDNVVYHGLAGHFFVKDVSHVLKVRIIAEIEDRVQLVMERESMTRGAASRAVKSIDNARRKWSRYLYGIDTNDPSLYDLVVHIKTLSTDDAAELICDAAKLNHFQATPQSQQAMDDLVISARITANLIERHPRVRVTSDEGSVHIGLDAKGPVDDKEIDDAVRQVPGVKKIEVEPRPVVRPD